MVTGSPRERPRLTQVKPGKMRPFADTLATASGLAQDQICQALHGVNGPVVDAMRYAVKGGKGLRAFLVMESCRLHMAPLQHAAACAGGIEALHAYSLIHDDLPCMDDDDLRRGQPTVHRKWDEATAVLAGDALQALAFELVGRAGSLDLLVALSKAAGIRGMVGGQALDIAAETSDTALTIEQITQLQRGKTGALITWSATVGPVLDGADKRPLTTYGEALGLAFQIWDDVLDVTGDAATVGKAVGKDAAAGKATFVSLLGLDGAKRRAQDLVTQACDALSSYGDDAETLKEAARFVIARGH